MLSWNRASMSKRLYSLRFGSTTTSGESINNHVRSKYQYWVPIQSRWKDNDMYGHINNTEYYSYFDTVINHFLIKQAGLVPLQSSAIGLCIESKCQYFAPLEFPVMLEAGLYVSHVGKSSLRYEVGIFEQGSEQAAAHGHFVHVFVDSSSRRPVAFPSSIREAAGKILVDDDEH